MRIAIIGGGAAGMMCAATINELAPSAEVLLLEKNPNLGKKVLISGGGRCNVTTGIESIPELLKKYPRGDKFLKTAMYHFSPASVRAWFESHGVPIKCEEDLRMFPVSDNGHDIVGAFEKIFVKSKTKVLFQHNVKGIERRGEKFLIHCHDGATLEVDKVVLSLGGQAYRGTGSTGDGYGLAEGLGHTITPLAASLNSFIVSEKWPKSVAGVSFEKATISTKASKRYSFSGPFVFTHWGVSGPAVFALSSLIAFEKYDPKNPLEIKIDLLPDVDADTLLEKIKVEIKNNPKKSFKNCLHDVPASLVEIIFLQNNIPLDRKAAEVSKSELQAVVKWMKQLAMHAIGRGAGDEFVTAGGVELSEVDPRTMESKKCPGLFFAGEILNIDGFTGGFNLQASWATGRVAGEHLAGVLE